MIKWNSAFELIISIDDSDRYHHKHLLEALVELAHGAGIAGLTVFKGIEGFGTTKKLHTQSLLSLSDSLPIVLVMIDDEEKINKFIDDNEEMLAPLLLTKRAVMVSERHGN